MKLCLQLHFFKNICLILRFGWISEKSRFLWKFQGRTISPSLAICHVQTLPADAESRTVMFPLEGMGLERSFCTSTSSIFNPKPLEFDAVSEVLASPWSLASFPDPSGNLATTCVYLHVPGVHNTEDLHFALKPKKG